MILVRFSESTVSLPFMLVGSSYSSIGDASPILMHGNFADISGKSTSLNTLINSVAASLRALCCSTKSCVLL
uniref:Similar to ATP-dependent helicase n=1 Tax=Arundo donax TaxID=35708 RepID=A0A0A9API2_ARUDO